MSEKSLKHVENKELSARLMAVQACYQMSQNQRPIRMIAEEYLARKEHLDVDFDLLPKPHNTLFKRILISLDERLAEINEIVSAHLPKKKSKTEKEGEEGEHTSAQKEMEPLLKAIITCGVAEILCHDDIETALIIDDYLNVTHSYYEKQQVALINGVLDNVAKLLRTQ